MIDGMAIPSAGLHGIALCAGYGGLEIALDLIFGASYRTVCYAERDIVQSEILAARMEDATIHPAPIWDDLTSFDGNPWRGSVDIVTAGFPCQPFSVAGKRLGQADDRWIWPDIARIIREVRPRFVFLENVPGLIRYGIGSVAGDLAEGGFAAEWDCFTAAEVGAPHKRERVFVLADAGRASSATAQHVAGTGGAASDAGASGGGLVDAAGQGLEGHGGSERAGEWDSGAASVQRLGDAARGGFGTDGSASRDTGHADKSNGPMVNAANVGHTGGADTRRSWEQDERGGNDDLRRESGRPGFDSTADEHLADTGNGFVPVAGRGSEGRAGAGSTGALSLDDASGAGLGGVGGAPGGCTATGGGMERAAFPPGRNDRQGWSAYVGAGGPEPAIRRGADGSTGRNDRLFSAGNGVVPLAAAYAFVTLAARLGLVCEVSE